MNGGQYDDVRSDEWLSFHFKTGVTNSSWRFPSITLFFTAFNSLIKRHINRIPGQCMNLLTKASCETALQCLQRNGQATETQNFSKNGASQ